MTAPARPARAGRDWRSVLGSALAAAASCGSLLSLTGLIDSGSWLRAASLAVALLALLTAGLRAATRTPWLPTVAGVVAGAVGVIAVYGGPNPDALPTSAVNPLRGVWVLGRSGIELMESSAAPMPAERSAELLVVIGAIGVFLLVDALALGLDVPALAALPLVAFWSPAVFLGFPTNGWGLFWTGLTYLLLLAVRSAPAAGADWLRHGSAVVAGAALLVVVALVAAPATAALPAWATASLPNFGTGPNGPIQLADNLDLRNSLTGHSSDTAFTYTVAASAPLARKAPSNIPGATPADGATPEPAAAAPTASTVGPLRVFTVDQFDGRQWIRTADPAGSHWQPGQVLGGAPETAYLSGSQAVDVQVTVANLEQFQLPIATFPRTVAITGPWRYDATSDEVIGTQQTAAGQKYTMQVFVPPLTGADLENAAVGTPPGGENYLELPTTAHLVDVQALARQIVGDATTPYAQAMALQSYLRSTANFTYDTTVPAA
ncbi:MAG: DUF3488 domain-containing protein, partial [Micrococcales bacterium]|nr:DUF3488 domain-containing protein [Micrococcales bacterium]